MRSDIVECLSTAGAASFDDFQKNICEFPSVVIVIKATCQIAILLIPSREGNIQEHIRQFHDVMQAGVCMDNGSSEWLEATQGLRLGCVLLPLCSVSSHPGARDSSRAIQRGRNYPQGHCISRREDAKGDENTFRIYTESGVGIAICR